MQKKLFLRGNRGGKKIQGTKEKMILSLKVMLFTFALLS